MDAEEEDAMAQMRLLFILQKRRERKRKTRFKRRKPPAIGADRVARLPEGLKEEDRFFAQIYANGHPSVFRENFRLDKDHFDRLLELCEPHIDDAVRSKRELLAVTLHWLGTGSVVRQQETKFQLAYSTCREYRIQGIAAITAALAHTIRIPTQVPPVFAQKFPHFDQALGAIDGTHIEVTVASDDANEFRSRKTTITTNVLIFCDWNLNICFAHAGAEGSAHDSLVLALSGLLGSLPPDFHVLADADYALTAQVLTPYRGVRYHLREWSKEFKRRPRNSRELYNLRHAPSRNAVERVIGILKRRFKLLRIKNESELETDKVAIFAACCVHNFIRMYNAGDLAEGLDQEEAAQPVGDGVERAAAHGNAAHGNGCQDDAPLPLSAAAMRASHASLSAAAMRASHACSGYVNLPPGSDPIPVLGASFTYLS
jgi:hypothetical protein